MPYDVKLLFLADRAHPTTTGATARPAQRCYKCAVLSGSDTFLNLVLASVPTTILLVVAWSRLNMPSTKYFFYFLWNFIRN